MALIDSEDAAGRLARVIVSDIELYNRQKLETGADIAAELQEGYAHYRSRVVPALLPLFEMVLADNGRLAGKVRGSLSGSAPAARRLPAARPAPQPDPIADEADSPTEKITTPAPYEDPEQTPPPALAPIAQAPEATLPEPPESTLVDTPVPGDLTRAPAEAPAAVDPEAAARRLARVIISDIEIYNPDRVSNRGDLSREINEGRALFRARVEARLLPIFEAMLAERGLSAKATRVRLSAAPVPIEAPTPLVLPAAPAAASPPPTEAPTPVLAPIAAADALFEAPTPLMAPAPPPATEAPTPAPTRAPTPVPAKPRARSVPPPLPKEEPPRWTASEPAVPAVVLASLPDPDPGPTPMPRSETPDLVVTLASGFDPTPPPVSTADLASPFAPTPFVLPAPPRPAALAPVSISAALRPRPATNWALLIAAAAGAALALAYYFLAG